MRFELAVSLRYFRSRRGEGAVSFITWIAIGGVMLGVAALVVAMSVMNGYETNLVRAMAGALPHISLHEMMPDALPPLDKLKPELEDHLHPKVISPYVLHETLLAGPQSGVGGVQGVLVRAIDPEAETHVPGLLAFLDDGSPDWSALTAPERERRAKALMLRLQEHLAPGVAPVLLSRTLAAKLGAKLGDRLVPLRFPQAGEGFSPHPIATRLQIIGYLTTGIEAFDELVVMMDIGQVNAIFPGEPLPRSIGMRLQDPLQAGAAAQWLRDRMQQQHRAVFVYSWLESNRGLFQVIRVQKTMLFLVLLLIVLLAFFGMIGALVMLVGEKTREITILKSLGARERTISRIFVMQGLLIGLVGTLLGVLLGLAVCWVLATFPVFEIPPGVYPGSDRVPVRVDVLDMLWVVGATLVICLGATLFPARKATSLKPVDGLRYG
ncbi:MAG TPA: ABC transporter permease [bacterium]|nr:ABC transporter permease [bacterium]